jgi:LCP family protein required for cell wall assembly
MSKRQGARRATPRRSPVWAKALIGVGAVLMVVSMATGGYAKIMLDKVNDSIDTEDLLEGNDATEVEGPLNFLMIGSDMRKDWNEAHSDSIMVLHINKELTKANIVSIPRDLYVTIQDCGDLYSSPCETKINDAFAVGGNNAKASVANLAATLTDLIGVNFDIAAMVNFGGFTDVVDTLGTVELCLPFDMEVAHSKNEDYPLGPGGGRIYPKGCNDYKKSDALGIVRERYSYGPETPGWTEEWGIGDFGRQHMQQHFVKQLLKEASKKGYVSDPRKVGTLIEEVGDKMLLDPGKISITDWAVGLRNIDAKSLTTLRVPSEPADIGGTSYVVTQPGEQEEAAQDLYKALVDDTVDEWIAKNPEWVNKDK